MVSCSFIEGTVADITPAQKFICKLMELFSNIELTPDQEGCVISQMGGYIYDDYGPKDVNDFDYRFGQSADVCNIE